MSNVIQFLEALGSSSRKLSPNDYAMNVATLEIEESQRKALMDRDRDALGTLLGGRPGMRCIIWSSAKAVA
jgi:hypothetical protein